jgi:alpha-glucosidase
MDWKASIASAVNHEFVSNPAPRLGEAVTIRLRHLPTDQVREVIINLELDGHASRLAMEEEPAEGGIFVWYRASFVMTQESVRYHFIIRLQDGNTLLYTRGRVTPYHPDTDRDFILETARPTPDWVKSSVFYQIFPDRFAPDAHGTGVRTGEYTYDGGTARAMAWTDTPLEYREGHCLDFFNGTLGGIEEKIPYLKSLGVNALYLNPIFTAKTTHRYDCTDYFHVDPHLGGDEALISLSAALHREGMRLILDVSINHTGADHPWFMRALADPDCEEAGYYYRNADGNFAFWFDTPTLPQLNYGSPAVWETIISGEESLVRHYVKPPFNIDGWRFDVGSMTGRRGSDQFSHEIFSAISKRVREIKPDAYLIGEQWEDAVPYLRGDQWDSAMNYFASCRPLRRFAGELDRFIQWTEAASTAPPTTGEDLRAQITQHFHRIPDRLVNLQFNLLDSHDLHRMHHHTAIHHPALYKGLSAFLFLLPGTPSIYYGDESGISGHDRTGEGCRNPMPWDEAHWDTERLAFFRMLIELKKKEKALQEGALFLPYADETGCLLVRTFRQDGFAVFLNRSNVARTVTLPLLTVGATAAENLESGERFPMNDGMLTLKLGPCECPVLRLTLTP